MDQGKYDRNVALLCPVCGGDQFEYGDDIEDRLAKLRCIGCERDFTKDALINSNRENIDAHVEEVKSAIVKDLEKDVQKMIKRAFRNTKNINLR